MAREKEIKVKLLIPLDTFIERILLYGFVQIRKEEQEDTYFDSSDWRLYKSVAAVRLRKIKQVDHSFCFKKLFYAPQGKGTYFVDEKEVHAPYGEVMKIYSILKHLGIETPIQSNLKGSDISNILLENDYLDKQIIKKSRIVYKKKDAEIVIDDVEHVGTIVEIETKTSEPLHIMGRILSSREWKRSVLGTGYLWLENVFGMRYHRGNTKRFKKQPDWNVWKNEKSLYNKYVRSI